MKRVYALLICAAMLLCLAGTAFAAVGFTDFNLVFVSTTAYHNVTYDTTSSAKKVEDNDYARLYIYSTSSTKNNVYRTFSGGQYTSDKYYKKTTDGTWMYYTSDVAANKAVYLKGRPDSSVPSCTITGEFGAG